MGEAPVIYAHTLEGQPKERWETLETHAAEVARLAREFASAFDAGDWGELLGRWHDLGKRSAEFQARIGANDPDAGEEEGGVGRVDHSTFGARHAAATLPGPLGEMLAFCIAGHHGHLPDAASGDETNNRSTLQFRLKDKEIPRVDVPPADRVAPPLRLPFTVKAKEGGFSLAFLTRMLFSALIDADRTATEAFCDEAKSEERNRPKPTFAELDAALAGHLAALQAKADKTPVNQIRAGVLADCLAAAGLQPGFFSLNVPTGGGKTFASLAFALRHALAHVDKGFRRVVVAIPFTSIIEQNADAYREALKPYADCGLVEHHSNIAPKRATLSNQLAAENWDAPLIVTTNVQLYESLFASRGTTCRKLHRLARSVIVLDEAQTIPVELLEPTLLALKELVVRYGCTVVLCTATQPALHQREGFAIGIPETNVRKIITDEAKLHQSLKRVEVERLGRLTDDELVDRLAKQPRVLCVVNTRPHAAKLYDALVARCGKEGVYHLSTFMCAQHRRDKLAEIRKRLIDGRPCRLVSTQLIEAGVDVDFPVVYRGPAGFDSAAQAAGRCNREGRLNGLGRVYLFDSETAPPPGLLRAAADTGRELAARWPDPLTPPAIEAYFSQFYWSQSRQWDKFDVLETLPSPQRGRPLHFKFREAAKRYQIIRDEQAPILVPYDGKAGRLIERFRLGAEIDYRLLRETQRYIVGVREELLKKLVENKVVIQHEFGLWLLCNTNAYTSERGLSPEAAGFDPLIA